VIVFFRAKCVFTERMPARFWRKARTRPYPFISLKGVGGGVHGYFSGMFPLEKTGLSDDELSYEIGSALVDKVELLSPVGVKSVDIEEITISITDQNT